MIVYQLACAHGHRFEGWFASAEACEEQARAGRLECPSCASGEIRRLPSAPYVKASHAPLPQGDGGEAVTRRQALQALRAFILQNTEDVGRRFPEVARRIHYREEEARGIRGQVTPAEALELGEEGIETCPVSPEVLPGGEVH